MPRKLTNMKFKTVREGEEAVIYNLQGEGQHIIGPSRVFLFRKQFQKLRQYTANQYEYLVVNYNSGVVKHIPGPCEIFCNPLDIQTIQKKESTQLDANHIIVVYKKSKDNSVQRRIVQGPTVFVPEAEEWLHIFTWHQQDPMKIGHMIMGGQRFTKLACIPDQFYYDVREVRTTDDTMVTVKLMIFYELRDVIKMLEATHDPIADLINAVCADVIAFAGRLTFEEFLQSNKQLNSLKTYEQLEQRSERIGYTVSKVVYMGYQATDKLQAMQDGAIQSRTKMRLNAELEDQRQRLLDFKLEKEQAREKMRQEIETMKQEHQQKVNRCKQTHQLHLKQTQHNAYLEKKTLEAKQKLDVEEVANQNQAEHLKKMRDLGVDLTQILINEQPAPVDQEIHVVKVTKTTGSGPTVTNL